MGFWTDLLAWGRSPAGITPNANPGTSVGEPDWNPGDPDGVDLTSFEEPVEARSLPRVLPSPWSGWPAEWNVPNWDFGSKLNELVDVAWTCLDLNASVLSSMPVYRTRSGAVIEPTTWMANPDPMVYTSWHEFAKQLFWDYQTGEAFVMSMARFSDGFPMVFRVVPPWLMHVEVKGGAREYRLGGPAGPVVTDDILHIRYKSTTDGARGIGPLESAGARMLTAGVLAKYVREVVSTGGVPHYWLQTDQELDEDEAQDLLQQWVASRATNLGAPPVFDNGVSLGSTQAMSPKDMAMLEISQFTEARIAVMLGVPPVLVGLPSGDSMTYSNVTSLFDFHDRASLRTKASPVMAALSGWSLPRGQMAELNRDEYTRPAFNERAEAWVKLVEAGIVSVDEVRTAERFTGEAPTTAPMTALTGGEQ